MLAFSSSTDLFWSCTGTEGQHLTDTKGVSGQFEGKQEICEKRPIKVNKAVSVKVFLLKNGAFLDPQGGSAPLTPGPADGLWGLRP